MKRATSLALPAGIGVVAGLRSMTAPAVVAWAAKRRLIRIGNSSMISLAVGTLSAKAVNLAITELLVDKLPLVPDRTRPGPMAVRALSGAACGAAVSSVLRRPAWEGAAAGAAGALAGALVGHYARTRARRRMSGIAAGLIEDAFAIGLAAAIIWQTSRQ